MQSIKAFELYFLLENHAISFQYLKLPKNSLSVRTDFCTVRRQSQHLHTHDYKVQPWTMMLISFELVFDFLVLFLFPYTTPPPSAGFSFQYVCKGPKRVSRMQATHQCIIDKDKVVPWNSVNIFSPDSCTKSSGHRRFVIPSYPCINKPLLDISIIENACSINQIKTHVFFIICL